jgi:hypothetical protein
MAIAAANIFLNRKVGLSLRVDDINIPRRSRNFSVSAKDERVQSYTIIFYSIFILRLFTLWVAHLPTFACLKCTLRRTLQNVRPNGPEWDLYTDFAIEQPGSHRVLCDPHPYIREGGI